MKILKYPNYKSSNIMRRGLRDFIDELIREINQQREKNTNENKKEDAKCTDSI